MQKLDEDGKFKCLYCRSELPISRAKYKNQVCNNECRKAYTKVVEAEEKDFWMAVRNNKKDRGRRCLTCGENCYPNYFYCNSHMKEDADGI
jgi:hypothetical protein